MPDALSRRAPLTSSAAAEVMAPVQVVSADVGRLRIDAQRAIRKICPRWLSDQADDLAQIAISRILDRLRATEGRLKLTPAYLYRAAYSVVIDEIRRRRRQLEVPLEQDVQSDVENPEDQTFSREVRDAIARGLARLAPGRRRAVTLYLLGHSMGEIGALLECRYKQAENLVYRGLRELRVSLRKSGVKP